MRNKLCCLCIATEVRIYKFVNSEAKRFIENIFKENGLHQSSYEYEYICYECKALLGKTYQFVKKTLTAQQILCNLYKDSNEITLDQVKAINRTTLNLSTNLTDHELYKIGCYDPEHKKRIAMINESYNEPAVKDEPQEYEYVKGVDDFNIDDSLDSIQHENESVTIKHECDVISDISLNDERIVELNPSDTEESTLKENSSNNKVLPVGNTFNKADTNEKISSKILENICKTETKTQKDDLKPEDNTLNKRYTDKHNKQLLSNPDFSIIPKKSKKINKYPEKVYKKKNTPLQPKPVKKNKRQDYEYDDEYEPSDSFDESDELDSLRFSDNGRPRKKAPDLREYPMKCDDCEMEIFEKRVHYYHYMTYHPKIKYPYPVKSVKFLCQFCGQVAKNRGLHEAHVLNHGSERKYVCHKCPNRFKNHIQLNRHLLSVHTDKFLECDYCGKKFKTREDISRHIRIHTGEKPFKCHICGAGYAHKGNVGIHIRSTHGMRPETTSKKKQGNGRKRRRCSTIEEEDEPLINIKNRKKTKVKTETSKKS